jgi:hypothetical protein
MKKGVLAIILLVFTGLLFITVGLLTAADMPDKITIDTKGYKKDIKGPVEFSHVKHSTDYGVACTECHHEYKDGKNIWKKGDPVKKCVECHDPQENQGNAKKLMTAYHKNCKDCHKKAAQEGKKAPTKCNDCHAKK